VLLTLLYSTHEQAAIASDFATIEVLLNKGTEATFSQAFDIYGEGSFSKSYAEIQLNAGAPSKIDANTVVTVTRDDDSIVVGTVMDDVPKGTQAVSIQYQVTKEGGSTCNVGGNPSPILDGCKFNSESFFLFPVSRGILICFVLSFYPSQVSALQVNSKSKVAIPTCLTRMNPKSITNTAVPSKDSVPAQWRRCESVRPVITTRTSRSSSTTTVMYTTPTRGSRQLLANRTLRLITVTVISVIILWRVALVSIE
jgi:hypothetical protein